MLAGRAQVYQVIGDYDKQKADAEAMLSIAENQDDPERKMEALLAMAANSLVTDVQKVGEHAERVIAIAEPAGDKGRLGRAYLVLGQQNQQTFNDAKAQDYLEKAAPLLKEAGLMKAAAENLSYLSILLGDLDKEAALQAAQEALEISKTTDDKLLQARTTRRVAIAQLNNYRFEEALHTSQDALDMFRAVGDRNGELHATNVKAIVNQRLGKFNQAEQGFLDTLNIAEEIGDDAGQRWGVSNILDLYSFGTGEYEKGLRLAETHAEKARRQSNQFVLLTHMVGIQGQLYRMGQYQKALDITLDNLAAIEEYYDLSIQILYQFYLSELHYRLGDETEGQRSFTQGEKLFAENDFPTIREFYMWRSILTVSLLRPGAFSFTEILSEMETLIHDFREKHHLHGLAEALFSISRLHLALAEEDPAHLEKALAALQEAEEIKKTILPEEILIEHQLYLHARAHRLAGQDEQADDYLKQAHDWLMACAKKITTPEYRQSYLENVPENIALQGAYQDRFGGESNTKN
jgi:tetratricopeptide (TPR) repeat protein